ncbi:hypothetical protein QUF07_07570 [Lentilactobacillus sp. TOM.63]|nr:hypothetical protein [Lentilactobacillus sp. TOM.63]MDM7516572.1 hypothetical protein [Lentilactobacillus sp. TOM.63]
MTNLKRSYWKYSVLSILSCAVLLIIELMVFGNVSFVDRIAFALILIALPGLWYDFIFRFSGAKTRVVRVTDMFLFMTSLIGILYAGLAMFIQFT